MFRNIAHTPSLTVALALTAVALVALPAFASAAPKPKDPTATGCTVSGNVVTAFGLPTNEVINFMVTDSSGTYGWVLGFTPDGTWTVSVPAATSPTTYQFVSRTWGPNGSKYTVFTSC